jgi:hypothetical protein
MLADLQSQAGARGRQTSVFLPHQSRRVATDCGTDLKTGIGW